MGKVKRAQELAKAQAEAAERDRAAKAQARPDLRDQRDYPMRLQKFLARAGVASRRGSESLISAGRVEVNGLAVTELGTKVDPLHDEVMVDGRVVEWGSKPVVLALNKPAGIITTMKDYSGRRCVADIMPTDEFPGLFPIGRLDIDTTGLLLFSTDGDLGNLLLHPRHHVTKVYRATVWGDVGEVALSWLADGVLIDDRLTAPAKVKVIKRLEGKTILEIAIHEGRYHQVKRMCEEVGHRVEQLERIAFGPVKLGNLPRGSWRVLEGRELEDLYHAAGLPTPDEAPQAGPGAARANARMRETTGGKPLKEES
jgi:23S rRNA pseudouridine2605 synthase